MASTEFEIVRTIPAPIEDVFARLSDIEGHNAWVPGKRSILRQTRQTSPGPVGLGTTYEDSTTVGTTPGAVEEYDAPTRIVYHWWDKTGSGKVKMEGWPGYTLEAVDANTTRVVHSARMVANGVYALSMPVLRWLARRERTTVLEGLEASFRS